MAVVQALHEKGLPAHQLMVGGDSAGGGLAAATLLNLKLQGLPQPAAAVLLSPWLDLALTGGSMQSNADRDVMLGEAGARPLGSDLLGRKGPAGTTCLTAFLGIVPTSRQYWFTWVIRKCSWQTPSNTLITLSRRVVVQRSKCSKTFLTSSKY